MRKFIGIVIILLVLSSIFTVTAFASVGQPTGTCAQGFVLHSVADIDQQMHSHIGTLQDFNGNGYVCMRMPTPDYCLVVDDSIPLNKGV